MGNIGSIYGRISASEETCEEIRPGDQSKSGMPNFLEVRVLSTIPLRRALVVAAMLAIVCALVVVPAGNGVTNKAQAANGVKDFTILHTNDEHSDVYPYALSRDANPSTGGFSRLATTIKNIKTAKTLAGEPVLTLSAGDWSQGTLYSWLEQAGAPPNKGAAPELSLMQAMGYDAVTIGNHDIELGPSYLAAELYSAANSGGGVAVKLPVLSSNIIFSGGAETLSLRVSGHRHRPRHQP